MMLLPEVLALLTRQAGVPLLILRILEALAVVVLHPRRLHLPLPSLSAGSKQYREMTLRHVGKMTSRAHAEYEGRRDSTVQ